MPAHLPGTVLTPRYDGVAATAAWPVEQYFNGFHSRATGVSLAAKGKALQRHPSCSLSVYINVAVFLMSGYDRCCWSCREHCPKAYTTRHWSLA
jgi:hypothetical protein